MRVRLTQLAEAELVDARDWYDTHAPGIGQRFMAEYLGLVRRLAENSYQFPAVRGEIRRAGFRHFPYGLFFRIGADAVEVFACFHASRNPRHWQRRDQ